MTISITRNSWWEKQTKTNNEKPQTIDKSVPIKNKTCAEDVNEMEQTKHRNRPGWHN